MEFPRAAHSKRPRRRKYADLARLRDLVQEFVPYSWPESNISPRFPNNSTVPVFRAPCQIGSGSPGFLVPGSDYDPGLRGRPPGLIRPRDAAFAYSTFPFRDPGPASGSYLPANFPGPPGLIKPDALSLIDYQITMPKSPRSGARSTPTKSADSGAEVESSPNPASKARAHLDQSASPRAAKRDNKPVPLNVPKVQRYTTYPIVNIAPKPSPNTVTQSSPSTQSVFSLQSPTTTNVWKVEKVTAQMSVPTAQTLTSSALNQPRTMLASAQTQQQVTSILTQSAVGSIAGASHAQMITQKNVMASIISQGTMTSQAQVLNQPTLFTQPLVSPQTSSALRTVVPSFQGTTFLAIPQNQPNSSQPQRFQLIRAPNQATVRGTVPLLLNQNPQTGIINLQNPAVLHSPVLQNQQAVLQNQFQTPIRIPLATTPPRPRNSPPELSPKLRPITLLPGAQPLTLAPQISPLQPPSLSPQRSPQMSPGQPPSLSPHPQLQPPKLSPHLPNVAVSIAATLKPIRQPNFSPFKNEETVSKMESEKREADSKTSELSSLTPKSEKESTPESTREADDAEPDFIWEEYLEDTGAVAAPPTAFRHVEYSLQSGFDKGMKLEVANKIKTDTYWVATVIMTCGPLLRLRYDGYGEDSTGDFWCDVTTAELHAIGWCAKNGKRLQPPEAIKNRHSNWKQFLVSTLTGAITAPSYLLDKRSGATPIDLVKRGMRVEVQDTVNPRCVWIAKILENVGGRLLMRYEGLDSAQHDFWLFYLNNRVHPMGWAAEHSCTFKPPDNLRDERIDYSHWAEVLRVAQRESENFCPPPDVFQDQDDLVPHTFVEGMKLEALSPATRSHLCAATVIDVVDNKYFIVEIDDFQNQKGVDVKTATRFFCHKYSHCLFPVNWASKRGLRVVPPRGWPRRDFDWDEYLDAENAKAAPLDCFNLLAPPHELKVGMKLEAVNPLSPHQICAATITRILDRLVWIHLDNNKKLLTTHVVDIESQDIYPVGWCASNSYQLKPPHHAKTVKRVAVIQPERPVAETPEQYRSDAYAMMRVCQGDLSPKIYFNHRCFSGRYLNKSRIAALPKSVGPGPVILVMKEVLTMLINTAYKSSRVLSELQLQGEPRPKMHQQVLKAKYKGKSYRAVVEMCRSTEQIDDFCRQTCIKLECCPSLVSTTLIQGDCPDDCSNLSKTSYHYAKKKKSKIGRPPGGHTNLENGARRPGPKKKGRSRLQLLRRKQRANAGSDADNGSQGDDGSLNGDAGHHLGEGDHAGNLEENQDDNKSTGTTTSRDSQESLRLSRKRTYKRQPPPPPSEIQTRGAKLPRFSLDRKTHQRIMLDDMDIPAPQAKPPETNYKLEDRDRLRLESNPLHWTVDDVVRFIRTTDCASMTRLFRQHVRINLFRHHDIDGQALLLLTLPTVQEHMELKFGPAIKLCHQIERIKVAFFQQYAK